jgi:hypothetical protein
MQGEDLEEAQECSAVVKISVTRGAIFAVLSLDGHGIGEYQNRQGTWTRGL